MQESEENVIRCLMEAMESGVSSKQAREDCGCVRVPPSVNKHKN